MPSRQINDFSQKGNRKKIELVAKPAKSQVYVAEDFMVLEVPPNKLKVASK